ncbi:MAG: DUF4870 domain-containing protein [Candidatus Eremiobacteraeota bacterium]|nr:DUF4870 domain-containing protein [Candidatus Eremiobacteraeota bacterium]MBC5827654.1 DUF4870 domain-containing protein [Candidatus Eremiobacteraeota bacterium]
MSCYYHPAVPTAVVCRDCGHEICSHCSVDAVCPGCRLGRAMQGTGADGTALPGQRGAQSDSSTATATAPASAAPTASAAKPTIVVEESHDDRLLAALCYPLWPVALLLLLLQSQRSKFLRFNIVQSLAVNILGVLFYAAYMASSHLPVIGWQSMLVMPFLMPAWFLFDLYLGVRAFGGQTTRVPLAAEYASKYAS